MNLIRMAMERLPGHWYQGGGTDGLGNFCGYGWVGKCQREATGNNIDIAGQLMLMDEVARELYPDRIGESSMCFPRFNDHPDTTESDVLTVMEKAAIKYDELH